MKVPRRWFWWAVFIYGLAALFWQVQQPIAEFPQLDAKENIALASLLSEGQWGNEPFYRAMLYPAILAIFLWVGLPLDLLPFAALFLGLALHFAATGLVARLAGNFWKDERAEKVALLLYGLNPVLLHYAFQPLDITLAIVLFLLGAQALFLPGDRSVWRCYGLAGLWWGLAVLARPHFLPLVLTAPLIATFARHRPGWPVLATWAGAAPPILLFGLANLIISGDFRLLPWQGAYNLYAANREGTTGKFLSQRVFLSEIQPWENPARLESEILFAEATGREPPFGINEMNAHWRTLFRQRMSEDTAGFVALQLRKIYFLFNDFEQYNNMTASFHIANSPVLRWNPIRWGGLFALAVSAFAVFHLRKREGPWLAWTLIAAVYAGALLIYFVSARFRLPLQGILVLFASGWATVWWKSVPRKHVWIPGAALVGALCLSFSAFFDARSRETYVQDRLLLANAAAEAALDAEALRWVGPVIDAAPQRPDARRVAMLSAFNLHLLEHPAAAAYPWSQMREWALALPARDASEGFVIGVVLWQTGEPNEAIQTWRHTVGTHGSTAQSALKALAAVGAEPQLRALIPPEDPEFAALLRLLDRGTGEPSI
ncbi:MAG: hypothetical protein JJT96_08250 [Opitutales bacterium]|nr:hypothetical protein [Opitutales bacterium]